MRGKYLSWAFLVFLATNCSVVLGVALFHWNVGAIIILYWLESIIIGVAGIVKVAKVKIHSKQDSGAPFSLAYFIVLFIIYMAISGVFVYSYLYQNYDLAEIRANVFSPAFAVVFLLLAANHIYSYFRNFTQRNELHINLPIEQTGKSLRRVWLVFAVLFFAAFFVTLAQDRTQTGLFVYALILLKIVLDSHEHRIEHLPLHKKYLSPC